MEGLPTGAQEAALPIGALSTRTGCNVETIRYYERIGLLPPPPRGEGGHRRYGRDHLKRLTFIRRSRGLGFTLDQVRGLLRLVDGGGGADACAEVRAVTVDHLDEVRRKLRDLERLEGVLAGMAAACDGGAVPACPVVEALFAGCDSDGRGDGAAADGVRPGARGAAPRAEPRSRPRPRPPGGRRRSG